MWLISKVQLSVYNCSRAISATNFCLSWEAELTGSYHICSGLACLIAREGSELSMLNPVFAPKIATPATFSNFSKLFKLSLVTNFSNSFCFKMFYSSRTILSHLSDQRLSGARACTWFAWTTCALGSPCHALDTYTSTRRNRTVENEFSTVLFLRVLDRVRLRASKWKHACKHAWKHMILTRNFRDTWCP